MEIQSNNSSIMEILTGMVKSLHLSFRRIFWTSLEMTWEKFTPHVTSTPAKSKSESIIDWTMKTVSSIAILDKVVVPINLPSRKRKRPPLENEVPSKIQRK